MGGLVVRRMTSVSLSPKSMSRVVLETLMVTVWPA